MKKTSAKLSLISILIVDLVLIGIALKSGLSITQLIWLYWCEGIIIGLIQFFKLFSTEITSFTVVDRAMAKEPNVLLTILFFALQIPFHVFFAVWIYHIEPTFDYVHGLLVMGAIILAHEMFFYLRDSRPWSEPEDLRDVIIESGIYFLRFIPLIAFYYFLVKKAIGEGNKTLLTVAFMLFKLVSDVISHLVEKSLVEREIIDDDRTPPN
jgi:hypothetical protein